MTVSKRETELDILRLLAILAVIAMHAGGNQYLSPNFNSNHHSMFVASIVWCVPVFFYDFRSLLSRSVERCYHKKNMEQILITHSNRRCCMVGSIYVVLRMERSIQQSELMGNINSVD